MGARPSVERPSGSPWQRVAVYSGGTVAGLAAARAPGGRVIFAATPAGVFRSVDGGHHWHPAGPSGALPFVTSVAASPGFEADQTVFAATWEGLFRSTDGGQAWGPVLAGGIVLSVAVSPTFVTDRIVLVGTDGDGILRSSDGGERWTGANAGLLDLTVPVLALSPDFQEDGAAFAGTPGGLFRSRSSGRSWQEVDLGLDDQGVQALALAPGSGRDPLIALGMEASGLLLSADGGATWSEVGTLHDESISAIEIRDQPGGGHRIVVATERAVHASEDRGQSWRQIGCLPAPGLAVLTADADVAGGQPATLVGLAGHGIVRLSAAHPQPERSDDGLSATPLSMLAISPDVAHDGTLFTASVDGIVLVSRDRGLTLDRVRLDLDDSLVTGLAISPRFRDDSTVWISTPDALYRSRDGARTWTSLPINSGIDRVGSDPDPTPARILTALQDAAQRVILFLAIGASVGRSDDGGETWQWLGPFDDREAVVALAARPEPPSSLVIFVITQSSGIGPDGVRRQTLWRSTNGGRTWESWLDGAANADPALLAWEGPSSDSSPLVATGRSVYLPRTDARERRGGLVRPLWRQVDLPAEVTRIYSLATPAGTLAGRTIFAATNAGVFVSHDGGRSYGPWSDGLEPSAVLTLAISPDFMTSGEVFALGPGGALWRRIDPSIIARMPPLGS